MSSAGGTSRVVGIVPWLPWPLSAWRWWTEPVRAERLAALRIGLAGFLLLDIVLTYLPNVHTYYGTDALGTRAAFGWLVESPRLSWSLLRGFGDPLLSFLALAGWLVATLWILADLATRLLQGAGGRERDPLRYSVPLWCGCAAALVCGIWSRLAEHDGELRAAWLPPAVVAGAMLLALLLELVRRLVREAPGEWRSLVRLLAAMVWGLALLGVGVYLALHPDLEADSAWRRLLTPWQGEAELLEAFMLAWLAATALLLVGCCTRTAALATWALSLSFANLNDHIDNAGDTIRAIILFYLMLCPCGAVWSVDRLWRRWRGTDADVLHVPPWPMRLLFIQLVFIYFCNGVYKVFGGSWRDGYSLYYVLCDFTLTRVSMAQVPLPLPMLRFMTWTVLAWEISFPLLVVLNRWTRLVALAFGLAFHLGIFVSMELGFFVPYALCLYLPLLPWERWLGRRQAPAGTDVIDVTLVQCETSGAA